MSAYSYYIITGFIKTLSSFTGNEVLGKTYQDVLNETDKGIYELVDFSIKMDVVAKFPVQDLERVVKKFDGNFLAMAVIKSLVRHRLYMKPIGKADLKQKICERVGITMEESLKISQRAKKKA